MEATTDPRDIRHDSAGEALMLGRLRDGWCAAELSVVVESVDRFRVLVQNVPSAELERLG